MNQLTTHGIVLSRTNFGEADRIIKFLTPDAGKLSVVARGVRKPKSKLAGGIELFSVSSLTYLRGRGDLGRLVSTRLDTHYGNIVKRLDRTQLGYELIKVIDRATEDEPEAEYFELLQSAFTALNDERIAVDLIRAWCSTQILALAGHTPNLRTDLEGQALAADQRYAFDYDNMTFHAKDAGKFGADDIKLLRLLFAGNTPAALSQVKGLLDLLPTNAPLIQTIFTSYIRV